MAGKKRLTVSFGDNYGKLTVISEVETYIKNSGERDRRVLCICECGVLKSVLCRTLRSGTTRSCGCLQKEIVSSINVTHGLSNTRQYHIWENMVARCTNPESSGYPTYGGNGVILCGRWKKFANFWDDMKYGYQEHLTLDRIDVKGGYSKDNCRWATKTQQSRNTRLIYSHNTSGYRGIIWVKNINKWKSVVFINNKA